MDFRAKIEVGNVGNVEFVFVTIDGKSPPHAQHFHTPYTFIHPHPIPHNFTFLHALHLHTPPSTSHNFKFHTRRTYIFKRPTPRPTSSHAHTFIRSHNFTLLHALHLHTQPPHALHLHTPMISYAPTPHTNLHTLPPHVKKLHILTHPTPSYVHTPRPIPSHAPHLHTHQLSYAPTPRPTTSHFHTPYIFIRPHPTPHSFTRSTPSYTPTAPHSTKSI